MDCIFFVAGTECTCGLDQDEQSAPAAPSALLRATTNALHFFVTKIRDLASLEAVFCASFKRAMSVFKIAGSMSERLLLTASLGAVAYEAERPRTASNACKAILGSVKTNRLFYYIIATLDQAMEVHSPRQPILLVNSFPAACWQRLGTCIAHMSDRA